MGNVWDEYRRRRRAFRLSFLLALLWLVPGSMTRRFLVERCGWDDILAFCLAVGLPVLGIISAAHLKKVLWPCPRCGRPFHVGWFDSNAFSRRCVHCRLPLWKTEPAEADLP